MLFSVQIVTEIAASSFLCDQKVVFFNVWNIEEAT